MNTDPLQVKTQLIREDYHWPDKVILIAEDIELNYMYIRELLEPTQAILVRVDNGKKALDYCLLDQQVDLILMDMLMPVMNGYEAIRQLRAHGKQIPVIAQTAYSHSEERRKAEEAGCNDFIAKPISREELLMKINRCFIK